MRIKCCNGCINESHVVAALGNEKAEDFVVSVDDKVATHFLMRCQMKHNQPKISQHTSASS